MGRSLSLNPVKQKLVSPAIPFIVVPQFKNRQVRTVANRAAVSASSGSLIGPSGAVSKLPIGDQHPDAHYIIAYINQMAIQFGQQPVVRESAVSIIGKQADNDVDAHIRRLVSFVRDNVRYVADPIDGEYIISPVEMIRRIKASGYVQGDCDDHVLLLNSLANSVGIPTRAVGVKLRARDRFDHVISSVNIRGKWIDIDPCVKSNRQPLYLEKLI